MKPLISVLLPIHNVESYIKKCLDSVVQQAYPNFEIIVVDDGSTDGSVQICKEFIRHNSNVILVQQENKGVSAARNRCIQEAHGEYYAFVDGDDTVEKNYLSELFALCEDSGAAFVACNHWVEGKHCEKRFKHTSNRQLSAYQACRNILYHGVPDVALWGKLYKAEMFEQIRCPEGRIYEDTYCIAELILKAGKIAYTSMPLYHYNLYENSISRGVFGKDKLQFLDAVSHLCRTILCQFPQLKKGCIRREVHAALSVRRYLVNCSPEYTEIRTELERIIKNNALQVLADNSAPLRDKIAICAVLAGPRVYDLLWALYRRKQLPIE